MVYFCYRNGNPVEDQYDAHVIIYCENQIRKLINKLNVKTDFSFAWRGWYKYESPNMSAVQNINPEKEPIPRSWLPRVITGGKDGGSDTPGPPPGKDWLSDLEPGTVFICRETVLEIDFDTYYVQYQGEHFTLIMAMMDNCELERRVGSKAFSNLYRDYHVVGFHPIEAPEEETTNDIRPDSGQSNRPD